MAKLNKISKETKFFKIFKQNILLKICGYKKILKLWDKDIVKDFINNGKMDLMLMLKEIGKKH